jgi:phosphonatase-like hydrolase
MVKAIVFDMAGTTVDEQNIVYKMLHQSVVMAGFDVTLEDVLRLGAGKEKTQAIADVLRDQTTDQLVLESIYQQFLILLDNAYANLEVVPQDGAEEVFRYLRSKSIQVVLNTGYNQETAEKLINKLQWKQGEHYDLLVTASQVSAGRPQPDMIRLAQTILGIQDTQEIIKIGDSIVDIEEGINAGCKYSIGITTGAQTFEQLQSAHPNYIIHHLLELKNIV